jgi:hypothetical protein
MKYFFFLFIIISLNSCNYYNNKIIIKNSSEKLIDSVLIFGNPKCEPLKISNIKPSTVKEGNLLNCNKTSNDGSYAIQVYSNNNMINKQYGYFTNGTPFFDEIIIELNKENEVIITED